MGSRLRGSKGGGGRGWGVGFVLVWGGLEVRRLATMKFVVNQCQRLVDSKWFEPAIIAIIVGWEDELVGLPSSQRRKMG